MFFYYSNTPAVSRERVFSTAAVAALRNTANTNERRRRYKTFILAKQFTCNTIHTNGVECLHGMSGNAIRRRCIIRHDAIQLLRHLFKTPQTLHIAVLFCVKGTTLSGVVMLEITGHYSNIFHWITISFLASFS